MIKAIIFDFAGIIGADGYWVWLKKIVPDLESKRDHFQKISEQVMLSKRLAIAVFLHRGYNDRDIDETLKVSTSTVQERKNRTKQH